jgi:H+-transporting ATPase
VTTQTQPAESLAASPDFQKLSNEECLAILKADATQGLTSQEVKQRITQYGPNQTPEEKRNPFFLFFNKFWGVTAWMLEITILLALIQDRKLDAGIIAALLFLNAILGSFQEFKASQAVEALKKKLQVWVRTLRDGQWALLGAADLVPGDIIRLRSGDFVPADLKILTGNLEVDLSALTGESEPKSFEPGTQLWSGAIVRRGEAVALVLLTGTKTFFGKTTQLVQLARPKLHFETVIARVTRWLLLMVGVLLAISIILWTMKGGDLLDILPLTMILLVSAIPVALPAMFTITLALGSVELVKCGILITRLNASEDAARMDILCSDKTGTLTANQLSLASLTAAPGFTENDILLQAMFCSQEANYDPIDSVFFREVKNRKLAPPSWTQKSFTPFDAKTRKTEAVIQQGDQEFKVVKGAVDTVLGLCVTCSLDEKKQFQTWVEAGAKKGYRSLAVAREDTLHQLKLVGIASLYDAPRADSKSVISELNSMGVQVKMLTGDALPIAQQVAQELGLTKKILGFHQPTDAASTEKTPSADEMVEADGFAGIYPEDKYRIVQGLQEKGHIIGMTGDGVNDAPALKQAEVGVAVENATDVAKGAASVVLTNEGLSPLPKLIQVGRSLHQRIEIWILNKIIKTFETVVFVVIAFIILGQFIVNTFGMVLLLFLIDFVTIAIATDRVKGSMKPSTWDITHLVKVSVQLGLCVILESFGVLWLGWHDFHLAFHLNRLHTFGFEILFYFGLFTVLVVREKNFFWTSRPSWPLLTALIGDMLLGGLFATIGIPGLTKIPIQATLLVFTYALLFGLVINDLLKRFLFRATLT